jgi:hypothetical protein
MNNRNLSLGIAALALAASSAAFANEHVYVDINPFGWGEHRPPVVYESPRYYSPPPVVYYGRGRWGEHRDGRGRDHDRGRSEHHDDGDRRH